MKRLFSVLVATTAITVLAVGVAMAATNSSKGPDWEAIKGIGGLLGLLGGPILTALLTKSQLGKNTRLGTFESWVVRAITPVKINATLKTAEELYTKPEDRRRYVLDWLTTQANRLMKEYDVTIGKNTLNLILESTFDAWKKKQAKAAA
jgi:hypothetical protein